MEIGESIVKSIILHQVGNRLREEPLVLSEECFAMTDSISNVILGGYLRGIIGNKNQYVLTHESDIGLNDVAHHVSCFFSHSISFIELSQKLATHLYMSTHHPNIVAGDLFVILFDKLKVGKEFKSAIGIYKSESKQQYISARSDGKGQQLELSIGINPDLIDKGVLIVDGSEAIYAIDRLSSRTKYWIDDFLKAKQVLDESTKSGLAVGLVGKISSKIESPMARQEFCRNVIALCSEKDELLGEEIKNISEKYTSPGVWDTELRRIIERKGLLDTGEITISTKGLGTKMKKVLNRIDLGDDIALIMPDNFLLSRVDFENDGRIVQINVILEANNG